MEIDQFIKRTSASQLPTATESQASDIKNWMVRFINLLAIRGMLHPGNCVVASILCHHELARHGFKPVWQAGTAMFRHRPHDDSDDDDMFSYFFGHLSDEDDGLTYELGPALDTIAKGNVGEVHAWVAIPSLGLIIDPAAPLVPEHAMIVQSIQWKYKRPSAVVPLAELGRTPPDVVYWPDSAAILALSLWAGDESERSLQKAKDDEVEKFRWLNAAASGVRQSIGWPPHATAAHLAPDGPARRFICDAKRQELRNHVGDPTFDRLRAELQLERNQ